MRIKILPALICFITLLPAQNNMLYYTANGNATVDVGAHAVSGNYTVEFWLRAATTASDPQLFTVVSPVNSMNMFNIGANGGSSFYLYRDGEGTKSANFSFGSYQWHHLAWSVSAARYTLYVDGNIVASGTNKDVTTLFELNSVLRIGGFGYWFYGYLDEIRVWNVTRTTSEIRSAMLTELTGTESGLLIYYPCNESSGTTLHDATSNHLDATLSGGVGFASEPFPTSVLYQGYAENVTSVAATLKGSYYPENQASQCYFEYGVTSSYGSMTAVQNVSATNGLVEFSSALSGLSPQTTYHFRSVFIVGTDTTRTADATMTTLPLPPTIQASAVTVTGTNPGSISVHWTNGNGQKRLVVVRETSAVSSTPVNATSYTVNGFIGDGDQIGTGNYAVHAGSEDSVTVTNLKEGTLYHAAVFEFNDGNGTAPPVYLVPAATASGNTTVLTAPSVPSSLLTFVDTTATRVTIRVNKGNGTGRLIVVKEGVGAVAIPDSNQFYEGSERYYSDGDVLNDDSTYVVSAGEDSLISVGGMNEHSTYVVAVYEYNAFENNFIRYTSAPLRDTITTKWHRLAVTAGRPTNITSTGATVHGTIYTDGVSSDVYFWYDSTAGPSGKETVSHQGLTDRDTVAVSDVLTGLSGATIYHVQTRAQNIDNQIKESNIRTFITYASSTASFGKALTFDGVNDYAETAVPVSAIDNMTIELRVKWNGATAGSQCLLYNGNPSYNGFGIYLFNTNGFKISVLAGGVTDVYANATLPVGTWTHLALVRSSGIWTLFIDGAATSMTYNNFSPNYAAGSLFIGGISGGDAFNGTIDDVRMWNIARTPAEITANAASCFTSAPTGLAGYWQFNENRDSTVYDLAGSNDLTLGNFSFDTSDGWRDAETSLPVEMITFTAARSGKNVILRWNTATEVNNRGFSVEKNVEGKSEKEKGESAVWTEIGFVVGHGTTNAAHSYSFVDASAAGTVRYRLKQVDRDGTVQYSQIVESASSPVPAEFFLAQNYPNPFNPSTTITFTVPVTGRASLRVYDAVGREVASLFNGIAETGVLHSVRFDGSRSASGVYFVRLVSGASVQVRTMMLAK